MDYDKLMAKARKTNSRRDQLDREAGFSAPHECDPSIHVATVMGALEAAIRSRDWNCVAEAQAMLEQLLARLAMRQ